MTAPRNTPEHFNAALDRRVHGTDDLARFAAQVERVANPRVPDDIRASIWGSILASEPAARPVARPAAWSTSQTPVAARHDRRSGFLPARLPAPAMLFLGILLAIVFAFTGLGNDGGEIVTPTARAEQAATAIATPDAAVPTMAIVRP
jgi:hypothetical protein